MTVDDRVKRYEDSLDVQLFNIMEAVVQPEKWAVDTKHRIVNVYPHPVLDSEGRIKDIVYKYHKYSLETDITNKEVAERYRQLQTDLKQFNADKYYSGKLK